MSFPCKTGAMMQGELRSRVPAETPTGRLLIASNPVTAPATGATSVSEGPTEPPLRLRRPG